MNKNTLNNLRASDENSWLDVIWEALETNEFPDKEWNDICTAMAWIEETLKENDNGGA